MDSSAIFRKAMGFYVGILVWPLLKRALYNLFVGRLASTVDQSSLLRKGASIMGSSTTPPPY